MLLIRVMDIEKEILASANKEKAEILQKFFKTGKGQYGEGDVFLGIVVPQQRKIAQKFKELGMKEIEKLLDSNIHEKRLIALLILIEKYKKADPKEKNEIFEFYLKNTKNINNWDLVDLSAPNIVGDFLADKGRDILYDLAKSKDLWKRRIAIISTFSFIRKNEFEDTLKITEMLIDDTHDLIHKSTGWMLREVGKRDQKALEGFLKKYYKNMPRTMLRYAIEKFPEDKRKKYLSGKI
jgi:3-methyladenine DNA glycosylase AlkD